MSKFLKKYLTTTGIMTGLVILTNITGLTILLFFVFPLGILLFIATNMFFWGCLYAIINWGTRRLFSPLWASATALCLTVFIVLFIPYLSISTAREDIAQYDLPDVTPDAQIRPSGHIRIELGPSEKLSCDGRCQALLFEPDVKTVTIALIDPLNFDDFRDGQSHLKNPAFTSKTYRLLPRQQCEPRDLNAYDRYLKSTFGKTWEDNQAIAASWRLKLATEVCITQDNSTHDYDLLIRDIKWGYGEFRNDFTSRWTLWPQRKFELEFGEIRRKNGVVLFRQTNFRKEALVMPLMIAFRPERGRLWQVNLGWGITPISMETVPSTTIYDLLKNLMGREKLTAKKNINDFLTIQEQSNLQTGINSSRIALRSVLNETSSSIDVIAIFFDKHISMLRKENITSEDLQLITDFLADKRAKKIRISSQLTRVLTIDQLTNLLPLMLENLSEPQSGIPYWKDSNYTFNEWPKGAFANPSSQLLEFIANPSLRLGAPDLIGRLSDMGEKGAPIIADIIAYHLQTVETLKINNSRRYDTFDKDPRRHDDVIRAGFKAMCHLGPLARSQLPQMEQLAERVKDKTFDGSDWTALWDTKRLKDKTLDDLANAIVRNMFINNGIRNNWIRWDVMMVQIDKPLSDIQDSNMSKIREALRGKLSESDTALLLQKISEEYNERLNSRFASDKPCE